MNKYTVALLLALLVVLAGATLRKSFASVVGSNASANAIAIGGSPMPPPHVAMAIGGSPMPPPHVGIGGSPMPPPH